MNQLLEKFNEYKTIVNYRMLYLFEDGTKIDFKLKQTDFPHLIGLHKLIDIPIIRQFNDINNNVIGAKYIISRIKKEELLTECIIRNSLYFPTISARFHNFNKENILSLSYTDVIVDFDAGLIGSNLKSKYILYENQKQQGYNHLCIAQDRNGEYYVESFFHNATNLYIRSQRVIKVKQVQIYDNIGKLHFEDTFL